MFESFPGCDAFAKDGRHACLVLPDFFENGKARLVAEALREAGFAEIVFHEDSACLFPVVSARRC